MFQLIITHIPQAIPAPVLGVCVWSSLTVFLWSVWLAFRDGIVHLRRLHQIPCSTCLYFTGDYRLKCTVNPCVALTEEAIGCRDFTPSSMSLTCSKCCKR